MEAGKGIGFRYGRRPEHVERIAFDLSANTLPKENGVPIHPQNDALEEMATRSSDAPVVMLNLLRFRETAEPGHGVDGMTGEQAYRECGRGFRKLQPRFGGEPLWMGKAQAVLVGAENEAWDLAILVRYSTRGQFLSMLSDPEYKAISPLRAAALSDSRLIEMTQLLPPSN